MEHFGSLTVYAYTSDARIPLAGAVQDTGVGTIVGKTSFGKGIVQSMIPFADGSGFQLTTARYYTPGGRCIHEMGIDPDVEVEPSDYDFTMHAPNPEEDPQLGAALAVVREEIGQ